MADLLIYGQVQFHRMITVIIYRFQEIAGAVETALYTPFAEATGLFIALICLRFMVDIVSLM